MPIRTEGRAKVTISDYNKDEDNIMGVQEVMDAWCAVQFPIRPAPVSIATSAAPESLIQN